MPGKNHKSRGIVLVSGAGSGIGEALSLRFSQEGYTVVGCGRNAGRLRTLKNRIEKAGGNFVPIQCDIRNEAGVRRVGKVVKSLGTLDILVNNAGVTYFKDFAITATREFDNVMETNVRGMFLLTKMFLPSMLKRESGLIINVISHAAKGVYTGSSVYSASKSAGSSMMNALREEVRQKNIKILNIYPGATFTAMWSVKNRSRFQHRMMRPADVAELIVRTAGLPASMMVEEVVVRPQRGDLRV